MKTIATLIKNNWKKILVIVFFISLIALSIHTCRKRDEANRNRQQVSMYEKLQDSIKTYKDREGNLVNQISVLESSNSKYFLDIRSRDSTIMLLQDVVKKSGRGINKPGGTAAVIEREIVLDTVIQKEVEYVIVDNKLFLKDSFKDIWMDAKYERDGDKSKWNFKTKDLLTMAIVEEDGEKVAKITNHSPYSNTKDVRVWQFENEKPKHRKWGIGVSAGYGVSFGRDKIQSGPTILVGVSRNLISF